MNRRRGQRHSVDTLAVLVLFCIFAVCVLGVLMFGTRNYRSAVRKNQTVWSEQTYVMYLESKIRSAPSPESISAEDFEGQPCLAIREDIDGDIYLTRIYQYDGWLRELFSQETEELSPEAGERVLEAERLNIVQAGDRIVLTLTAQDCGRMEITACVRGREG